MRNSRPSIYKWTLVTSFIPLILQGVIYLSIGVVYPLLIGLVITCGYLYFFKYGSVAITKVLKTWGILLIGYAAVRITVHVLMFTNPGGVPSGAFYQFDLWYGIKSIIYLLLGGYILLFRKQFDKQKGTV